MIQSGRGHVGQTAVEGEGRQCQCIGNRPVGVSLESQCDDGRVDKREGVGTQLVRVTKVGIGSAGPAVVACHGIGSKCHC